jgi:hypothetical protein
MLLSKRQKQTAIGRDRLELENAISKFVHKPFVTPLGAHNSPTFLNGSNIAPRV